LFRALSNKLEDVKNVASLAIFLSTKVCKTLPPATSGGRTLEKTRCSDFQLFQIKHIKAKRFEGSLCWNRVMTNFVYSTATSGGWTLDKIQGNRMQ
jgi:hypothetical protein